MPGNTAALHTHDTPPSVTLSRHAHGFVLYVVFITFSRPARVIEKSDLTYPSSVRVYNSRGNSFWFYAASCRGRYYDTTRASAGRRINTLQLLCLVLFSHSLTPRFTLYYVFNGLVRPTVGC
jgi:hypothetical protein